MSKKKPSRPCPTPGKIGYETFAEAAEFRKSNNRKHGIYKCVCDKWHISAREIKYNRKRP